MLLWPLLCWLTLPQAMPGFSWCCEAERALRGITSLALPSPCSRVLSTSGVSQLRGTEARNGAIAEESSQSCAWVQRTQCW